MRYIFFLFFCSIKTTTVIGEGLSSYAHPEMKTEHTEPSVECILPDDDDVIISDVRDTAAPPAPPPAPPAPPVPTTKPLVLNNRLYKPAARGIEAQQGVRVTVGNGSGAPISSPKTVTPPKIILKPYVPPPALIPKLKVSAPSPAPPVVQAIAPAPVVLNQILPNDATICLDSDDEESRPPRIIATMSGLEGPVPVALTSAHKPELKIPIPAMQNLLHLSAPATQCTTTAAQKLVLRQVVTPNGTQPQFVLVPSDKLPMPTLNPAPEPPNTTHALPKIVNTVSTAPAEPVIPAKRPEISRASCKPGDILRISKTGVIEVITRADLEASPAKPASDPMDTDKVVIENPKPTTQKPTAEPNKKPSASTKFRKILPKPSRFESLDLTSTSTEVSKPKPGPKSAKSSTVDLTNQGPASKPKSVAPKPSTTETYDLTQTNEFEKKKTTPHRTEKNAKVDARKSRQISNSSSSSDSRAASPDNPLSILKDVVHIKAPDYPDKGQTMRSQRSSASNISVQHVISKGPANKPAEASKGSVKLTKVPKELVPKHIDEAVEKQIRKEALMKKITPLLSKNQPKPKAEVKNRGKNMISFDTLSSAHTSKLLKNTGASKPTDSKSKTVLKPTDTVDLT